MRVIVRETSFGGKTKSLVKETTKDDGQSLRDKRNFVWRQKEVSS